MDIREYVIERFFDMEEGFSLKNTAKVGGEILKDIGDITRKKTLAQVTGKAAPKVLSPRLAAKRGLQAGQEMGPA